MVRWRKMSSRTRGAVARAERTALVPARRRAQPLRLAAFGALGAFGVACSFTSLDGYFECPPGMKDCKASTGGGGIASGGTGGDATGGSGGGGGDAAGGASAGLGGNGGLAGGSAGAGLGGEAGSSAQPCTTSQDCATGIC